MILIEILLVVMVVINFIWDVAFFSVRGLAGDKGFCPSPNPSQPDIACSKLKIETPEQGVKYVHS